MSTHKKKEFSQLSKSILNHSECKWDQIKFRDLSCTLSEYMWPSRKGSLHMNLC